ncbi:polymorphic toxin-type HINT domain-containing protein [Streptomyces sp. NPDC058086]|uniref:polymorphic toxin-type HINT domain-containing protein n=1 Tax=Streptomyces sp. NPDC058086 TaxID=3346334 RepID=UPI0036E79021
MADGGHKAIRDVSVGDLVRATDPETGRAFVRRVVHTMRHDTRRLVEISVADGKLSSTAGHRFFVEGRGWTLVSSLHVGDNLRTPNGTFRTVTAVEDRAGLAPREVYDLTVESIHTFYVSTEGAHPQNLLVHNCQDLVADEDVEGAHTIGDHVTPDDDAMKAKALDPRTTGGVATRWASLDIAREAVDKAVTQWLEHDPDHLQQLVKWQNEQALRKSKGKLLNLNKFRWEVRDVETRGGPIGYKWVKNGTTAEKSVVTSK